MPFVNNEDLCCTICDSLYPTANSMFVLSCSGEGPQLQFSNVLLVPFLVERALVKHDQWDSTEYCQSDRKELLSHICGWVWPLVRTQS